MRVSIPGFKGLYFDTDAESPAVSIALTAAGRRAPKPQGYAVQLLPYLWSFDVDLREVPNDHPIQYLHPEGAQSLGELPAGRSVRQAGNELDAVLQFVWAVNQQVESSANRLVGHQRETEGIRIEIDDGKVGVDGEELETDAFDVDEGPDSGSVTEIDIEDGTADEGSAPDEDVGTDAYDAGAGTGADEFDPDESAGADEFDADDDIDPDEP